MPARKQTTSSSNPGETDGPDTLNAEGGVIEVAFLNGQEAVAVNQLARRRKVVRGRIELPTHGFSVRADTPENPGETGFLDLLPADRQQ